MTKVYACLAGNWVCLNDDPECVIGSERLSPYIWWEESAPLFAPHDRKHENSFYDLNYVQIFYQGCDWRINPIFVQIASV